MVAVIGAVFILTGCGGSEDRRVAECSQEYWDGTYGTCLPSGWVILERETLLQRGATDEFPVAFQAVEPEFGQFPIITLTREPLTAPVDAASYSETSVRSVATFTGYVLIDVQDFSLDGAVVGLHSFRARPSQTGQERRFLQVSTTAGEEGYTLTAMVPVDVSRSTEEQILKIFGCSTWQKDETSRKEFLASC